MNSKFLVPLLTLVCAVSILAIFSLFRGNKYCRRSIYQAAQLKNKLQQYLDKPLVDSLFLLEEARECDQVHPVIFFALYNPIQERSYKLLSILLKIYYQREWNSTKANLNYFMKRQFDYSSINFFMIILFVIFIIICVALGLRLR